ncbi:hypothetical protein ACIP79_00710 [Streptomyces sp. NPDC088747]|uniref:hypothetical protein n=1 Tax=Streptomyces sp. NPDC088747 TaxID=3365886 RepID=UPI0038116B1D
MTTIPEPVTIDRSTRPDIAHLRCLLCFPTWIPDGTFAVCGYLFKTDGAEEALPEKRCVVCVDMEDRHFVLHYMRGEMPGS